MSYQDNEWTYRQYIEKKYIDELRKIGKFIFNIIETSKSTENMIERILKAATQEKFDKYCRIAARNMVQSVAKENARTWRKVASGSQHSYEIHRLLKAELENNQHFQELINHNVEQIKSIPETLTEIIKTKARSEALAGKRGHELTQIIIEQTPDMAKWKATQIARTEISKTNAIITQVRAQAIGLNWYYWRTAQDQRVRTSHKHMNGVVCDFANPPAPEMLIGQKSQGHYGPGQIYNCRCIAAVITDITDMESFPVKLCNGNKIIKMTKLGFSKVFGE